MAIKNLIAGGIGFTPGSVKYIPTLGFSTGTLIPSTAHEQEVLTIQLGGGLGRSINVKKAINSLKDELESFIFFMGGR